MKFFWQFLPLFFQTDYWNCEILLDDHFFCSPIAVLQAII